MAGGRRSGSIIIILALLLIVGLGGLFFLFRNQLMPPAPTAEAVAPTPDQAMVNIVITTQFVSRGTKLTENVLTTVPYPEKDLVQGTFYTEIKDIVGKQAKYDLEARLPLTSSLIVESPLGSGAAFQIPKGMVAISVPISRLTSVSYAPLPGDHVNVLVSLLLTDVDANFQTRMPNNTAPVFAPGVWSEGTPPTISVSIPSAAMPAGVSSGQGRVELDGTMNQAVYVVPSEVQRPRPVSQTLIQDAIVLHVGSFLDDEQAAPSGEENPEATAEPTPEPVDGEEVAPEEKAGPEDMTLIVSPQDAVTLNYLMLIGAKLNIVLRSAGDVDRVNTEAVTLQFLMDQYNIPNPSKLPYAVEPRVDELKYPDIAPTPTPVQ